MKELLEIYNLELQVQGLSPTTIKNKISRLNRFCEAIGGAESLDKTNINKYIASLKLSDRSKNEYIKTIRVFLDYLHEEGYIDKPISIKSYKCDEVIQQELTDKDIEIILKHLKKDKSWLGVRNYTIVSVLIDTGLRISELVSLDIEDIEDNIIKVKCKRKERLVPISAKLKLQLKKYLIFRDKPNSNALFTTKGGNRLQVISVQKMIKKLGETLDINLHCHLFRHYFIQSLLRKDVNLFYISKVVGHSNIQTTQEYLKSMNDIEIVENLKKYSNL